MFFLRSFSFWKMVYKRLEIYAFEIVNGRTHGRTDGLRLDYHTKSSPCEPSAQASSRHSICFVKLYSNYMNIGLLATIIVLS